jgi:hypothetical protein
VAPRIPWPAGWGPRPLVEPVEGGYRVNLSRIEQRVLQQSFDDLRVMLVNDDPSTRRLAPTAYPDDPALDEEYRQLIGDDLVTSQLAAFDVVERSIGGTTVSPDELQSWMRSVNSVRLVIGTQLDVGEDVPAIARTDPDYPRYVMYDFLGNLLMWIVTALQDD